MKEHKIYVLVDPREPEHVRYVGYTSNTLEKRLGGHLNDYRHANHKGCWVKSLLDQHIQPIIKLYMVVSEDSWRQIEIDTIAHFKVLNHKLTNATIGGDGVIGYQFTDEDKLKMGSIVSKRNNERRLINYNFIVDSGYNPLLYKQCSQCKSIILKSEFYQAKDHSYDDLSSNCKECCKYNLFIRRRKASMLSKESLRVP